jgi:hypothetical protein
MEDSNVKLDEWWELVEVQFKEEKNKNMAAHKKDEDRYKRHLPTFKKAFKNFMYS